MNMEKIVEALEENEESAARSREIAHRIAMVLDEYEASSFDAVRAVAFVLGSATESLADDTGISIDKVASAVMTLVTMSAHLHAEDKVSTEGMTAN